MRQVGVMHIIDTLDNGGAERVCVNYLNLLPRHRYRPYLCTTRRDGPLLSLVLPDVEKLSLRRVNRFSIEAVLRLARYLCMRRIRILHAHMEALFIARAASIISPGVNVIWHDHYGRCELEERSARPYRLATRGVSVITVNQQLRQWALQTLGCPPSRVQYLPNFVLNENGWRPATSLPGKPGNRIICVANFRPQKDHLTLIDAMKVVATEVPEAHLLLAGATPDTTYLQMISDRAKAHGLSDRVTFLGQRNDVPALLMASDVAVLPSLSEGFPLSILEYGFHGLAVVATSTGQCPEILDDGRAGILVPTRSPSVLGSSIIQLLRSPEQRRRIGLILQDRVRRHYSADAIMLRLCAVYESLLDNP